MLHDIITYVNYYTTQYQSEKYDTNFIKLCLAYKFLSLNYLHKNVAMATIISLLDRYKNVCSSPSRVLTNHRIFSRAFKEFWINHKKGRGYVYVFDSPFQQWPVLGLITGITYLSLNPSLLLQ